MKIKAIITVKGNYVFMLNGREHYYQPNTKRTGYVEQPCFNNLIKNHGVKCYSLTINTVGDMVKEFPKAVERKKRLDKKKDEAWLKTAEGVAHLKQIEEKKKERQERRILNEKRKETERKEIEKNYNHLLKSQPIDVNIDNFTIILKYLNEQNWGSWCLPQLKIGYTANQYDCDGRIASTITLSKPINIIDYWGNQQSINKFSYGNPRRHLNKYYQLY